LLGEHNENRSVYAGFRREELLSSLSLGEP